MSFLVKSLEPLLVAIVRFVSSGQGENRRAGVDFNILVKCGLASDSLSPNPDLALSIA